MKIKYGQLSGLVEAVNFLRKQEQDFATARRLLDVCDAVKKEHSFFCEQMDKLINKFAKKNSSGKPEISEDGKSCELTDPEAFSRELTELMETESADIPTLKGADLAQFKMSAEQLD